MSTDLSSMLMMGARAPWGLILIAGFIFALVQHARLSQRRFLFVAGGLGTMMFASVTHVVFNFAFWRFAGTSMTNDVLVVSAGIGFAFTMVQAVGMGLILWGALTPDTQEK